MKKLSLLKSWELPCATAEKVFIPLGYGYDYVVTLMFSLCQALLSGYSCLLYFIVKIPFLKLQADFYINSKIVLT